MTPSGRQSATVLDQDFFARPVADVARDLIGKVLVAGEAACIITETEAYGGPEDAASHAAWKKKPGRIMYEAPGTIYVYLIYGMHHCLNVVTQPEGSPSAVLIRGARPLVGLDLIRTRRGVADERRLTDGPGKLCQALQITMAHNGSHVNAGQLEFQDLGYRLDPINATPRIGIAYAGDAAIWPWRFVHPSSAKRRLP